MSIRINNKNTASTVNNGASRNGVYQMIADTVHYQPARTNDFEFEVNLAALGLTSAINTYATDANNINGIVKLSVASTAVPHFSIGTIEVKRGNSTMKFAGSPTFEAGSVTVNDFIGAGTKDIIQAWVDRAYDVETDKTGLASDYKTTAWLTELTPDHQVVRVWTLKGCWCSGISGDDYNAESTDKKQFTITLQYDKATVAYEAKA